MALFNTTERSDDHYFQLFLQGDVKGFSVIFYAYYPDVVKYAERMLCDSEKAKDVVAEVFIKIWQIKKVFESRLHLKKYLFLSVRNHCFSKLREQQRRSIVNIESFDDYIDVVDEEAANERDLTDRRISQILEAVTKLPPRMREIFTLRFLENRSIEEIGIELGISQHTVRNLLHRARSRLVAQLSEPLHQK